MNELITVILCYLGVFFLAIGIVAFLFKGFFRPYMLVKGSRGKKVLVKIFGRLEPLLLSGTIEEDRLKFKIHKEVRFINIKDGDVYRWLGVNCVDIDGIKNAIFNYGDESSATTGYDAVRINDLYLRALMKPSLTDPTLKIILVLCIVILLASLGSAFIIYKVMKTGQVTYEEVAAIKQILINQTGVIQ